jgi:hypothetical protein
MYNLSIEGNKMAIAFGAGIENKTEPTGGSFTPGQAMEEKRKQEEQARIDAENKAKAEAAMAQALQTPETQALIQKQLDEARLAEEARQAKLVSDAQAKESARLANITGGFEGLGALAAKLKEQQEAPRPELNLAQAIQIDPTRLGKVTAQTGARTEAERILRGDVADITTDKLAESQFRGTQADLIAQLQAQAAGTAPSLAELQAKRAGERTLAQQLAFAAGATGPQAALARRQAAGQIATTGQEIAATAAEARIQEQRTAQQLLGQVAGQARQLDVQKNMAEQEANLKAQLANQGVDLDIVKQNAAAGNQAALANLAATTADMDRTLKAAFQNQAAELDIMKQNAALGNQTAIANMDATLKKMGLDDAMTKAYMQNELGLATANIDAALKTTQLQDVREQNIKQNEIALAQLEAEIAINEKKLDQKSRAHVAELEANRDKLRTETQAQKEAAILGAVSTLGAAAITGWKKVAE